MEGIGGCGGRAWKEKEDNYVRSKEKQNEK